MWLSAGALLAVRAGALEYFEGLDAEALRLRSMRVWLHVEEMDVPRTQAVRDFATQLRAHSPYVKLRLSSFSTREKNAKPVDLDLALPGSPPAEGGSPREALDRGSLTSSALPSILRGLGTRFFTGSSDTPTAGQSPAVQPLNANDIFRGLRALAEAKPPAEEVASDIGWLFVAVRSRLGPPKRSFPSMSINSAIVVVYSHASSQQNIQSFFGDQPHVAIRAYTFDEQLRSIAETLVDRALEELPPTTPGTPNALLKKARGFWAILRGEGSKTPGSPSVTPAPPPAILRLLPPPLSRKDLLARKDLTRKEDTRKDDPKKEDNGKEDIRKEDNRKEDNRKEDNRKEDNRKEDNRKEDNRKEDNRKEDNRKEDDKDGVLLRGSDTRTLGRTKDDFSSTALAAVRFSAGAGRGRMGIPTGGLKIPGGGRPATPATRDHTVADGLGDAAADEDAFDEHATHKRRNPSTRLKKLPPSPAVEDQNREWLAALAAIEKKGDVEEAPPVEEAKTWFGCSRIAVFCVGVALSIVLLSGLVFIVFSHLCVAH